ncbi:MAG: hypothetical protein ABW173_04620 [Sphingomonas sp.]
MAGSGCDGSDGVTVASTAPGVIADEAGPGAAPSGPAGITISGSGAATTGVARPVSVGAPGADGAGTTPGAGGHAAGIAATRAALRMSVAGAGAGMVRAIVGGSDAAGTTFTGTAGVATAGAGVAADTSAPTGTVAAVSVPRNDGTAVGAADVPVMSVPKAPPLATPASPPGAAVPGPAKIAAKGSVAADEIMRVSGGAAASPSASL